MTSSSDSSSLYTSTVPSGLSVPSTFKRLIPLPPILGVFPPHLHHHFLLLAVSLHLLLPLFPLTASGFFKKMLAVSEPGALNFYTFSCRIRLTLFVFRNLTLTHLPLSGWIFCLAILSHPLSVWHSLSRCQAR